MEMSPTLASAIELLVLKIWSIKQHIEQEFKNKTQIELEMSTPNSRLRMCSSLLSAKSNNETQKDWICEVEWDDSHIIYVDMSNAEICMPHWWFIQQKLRNENFNF